MLEQDLDEKRQAAMAAKEAVRVGRRRYNAAMQLLETISSEIMEAKEARKEARIAMQAAAMAKANEAAEELASVALSPGSPGSDGSIEVVSTPLTKQSRSPSVLSGSPLACEDSCLSAKPSRARGVKRL